MTDEELDQIETDQLLAALRRRFDACVFIEYRDLDKDHEYHKVWWYGGRVRAIGLMEVALHETLNFPAPERLGDEDD